MSLNTIWLLHHTDIISNIESEFDLDMLAKSNQLLEHMIKTEKKRRSLRVLIGQRTSVDIHPKYHKIVHDIAPQTRYEVPSICFTYNELNIYVIT